MNENEYEKIRQQQQENELCFSADAHTQLERHTIACWIKEK